MNRSEDPMCKHCGCPRSRHHPASGCCPLPYGGFPDEHDNDGYSLFMAFESDPQNGVAG